MRSVRSLVVVIFCILPVISFSSNREIQEAFDGKVSQLQVIGNGVVVHLLADDLDGSRHQRFILKLDKELTVLIAHNIDLVDRISNIKFGDEVKFYGSYEWNSKGGVVHWTHHAPRSSRFS